MGDIADSRKMMIYLKKNWVMLPLLIVVILSFAMRFWEIGSVGISQPDGGNYVRMSTWLIGQFGRPMYWEPPVYPASVSLGFLLFGVRDYVAVAVTAFYGVLLVLATWLLGREIFDDKTGAVASLLMACTEFAIVYSRDVLADSTFTFFLSMSFLFFLRSLRKGRRADYAAFGIFSGLSLLTKAVGFASVLIPAAFLALSAAWGKYSGSRKSGRGLYEGMKPVITGTIIMLLMLLPWIFAIGIGIHASSGGASYFSLSDINFMQAVADSPEIMCLGIRAYASDLVDLKLTDAMGRIPLQQNYAYYILLLSAWVSPLVLLFFIYRCTRLRYSKNHGEYFLLAWFLSFFLLFTFIVLLKGSRFIFPALPPLVIIASRGIVTVRPVRLFRALLLITVVSCILLSLDSITQLHNGFRGAGQYISRNVAADNLIFYTGMPNILFYHEVNTGNWWNQRDFSRTGEITHVVIEYHAYEDENGTYSYFDLRRFERDFAPAAVFRNEDPIILTERWASGKAAGDTENIKIYRPDISISGYFRGV